MSDIDHSPLVTSGPEKNYGDLPSCEKWCPEDEHAQRDYVIAISICIEFWTVILAGIVSQWWVVFGG